MKRVGGWLAADGTILGADNGLGVAFICMLLADKSLRHPPIEALVTSGEETGMLGMNAFDGGHLRGNGMINLDAEENGVLIASCAGGTRSELTLPVTRCRPNSGSQLHKIRLSRLSGGHSGVDIHKGGGNALLLLGRLMETLTEKADIQICGIAAGATANVIPVHGVLTLYMDPANREQIKSITEKLRRIFADELPSADGSFSIELSNYEEDVMAFTDKCSANIARCIALLPHGAMGFHERLPGQVRLSNNPGTIKTCVENVVIQSLTRGNINSTTDDVVHKLRVLSELCGGSLDVVSSYGAWEYTANSPLRELALQSYRRRTGEEMAVSSIHGGLECALMAEKIEGIDMISLGPTLLDVHTPNERFEVETAASFWAYLAGLISGELS